MGTPLNAALTSRNLWITIMTSEMISNLKISSPRFQGDQPLGSINRQTECRKFLLEIILIKCLQHISHALMRLNVKGKINDEKWHESKVFYN